MNSQTSTKKRNPNRTKKQLIVQKISRIMCILYTPRPTYRWTYRPTADRRIGRHISRVTTDMLVDIFGRVSVDHDVSLDISADISVEHQSICRLTLDRYVGRYVDREWLFDCRPACRAIDYRHSADTSLLLVYC